MTSVSVPAVSSPILRGRAAALLLVAPALAVVGLFFVAPLGMSAVVAFRGAIVSAFNQATDCLDGSC